MRSLALLLPLAVPLHAQTAILRQGDPAPPGSVGQVVSEIGLTAVNQTNGSACSLAIPYFSSSVRQLWGSVRAGAGAPLRNQGIVGNYAVGLLDLQFGISGAGTCYSAECAEVGTTQFGRDSLWVDDVLIAIEGEPAAGSSELWTFIAYPGITQDGNPYFLGGVTGGPGPPTPRNGLFFGTDPAAVYFAGKTYPHLPSPLSGQAVGSDFGFSAYGTHHIAVLDLDVWVVKDGVIAIDGAGLLLDGVLVQESVLIPPSVGGVGDAWDDFGYVGIAESGEYTFTCDTLGPGVSDHVIVRNGVIWAREGDVLDGETLRGWIQGASLNENGELAFLWSVEDAQGPNRQALFFENEVLLRAGDAVDWDGDGTIDPEVTIVSFAEVKALSLAPDGTIYFVATVETMGFLFEAYFRLDRDGTLGESYCNANPNSTGGTGEVSATGSAAVADNDVTLAASGLPPNVFGFFLTSETRGFVANPGNSEGNVCLGGAIGRYAGPGQILPSGPDGTFSLVLDLTQTPQPTGTVAIGAGESWNFQAWYRDTGAFGPTLNFTDALEITFTP